MADILVQIHVYADDELQYQDSYVGEYALVHLEEGLYKADRVIKEIVERNKIESDHQKDFFDAVDQKHQEEKDITALNG